MNGDVGYAILGCGLMGGRHAEVIRALPGARLDCAFDADEDRLRGFCESHGCEAAASAEEAAARPGVGAVLIATPSFLHGPQSIAAARAGKHVLVEKPLATDAAQAEEAITACREAGVRLSVVSQKRFHPDARRVKVALDAGLLGRVFLATVTIHYNRDDHYFAEAPWRASGAESGGGVLMNQGIHYADLLFWYLGPAARVRAAKATVRPGYEEEDVAAALIELESGALATLSASTATFPNAPETLTLYGTEGSCALVEGKGVVRWDHKAGAELPEIPPESPVPEGLNPRLHSMYRNHADFLAAVRGGRAPLVTPEEALSVVVFMERLYDDARGGA